MGADLYISKIFNANRQRTQRNFNRAVADRDSIFPRCFDGVGKIDQFVRNALGQPLREFDESLNPVPENMKLPADLEPLRDKYNKFVKAQARVSKWYSKMYEVGYFRDSYNGTSLFWRLGMSWWKCPYIKNGEISPENAKLLLAKVRETQMEPVTAEELKAEHCAVDNDKNSPESWNKYFLDKKEAFCAFLQEAIDKNLVIEASV
jgi:hypothetical protein